MMTIGHSTLELDGFSAAINIPANYATYGGITRSDIPRIAWDSAQRVSS